MMRFQESERKGRVDPLKSGVSEINHCGAETDCCLPTASSLATGHRGLMDSVNHPISDHLNGLGYTTKIKSR